MKRLAWFIFLSAVVIAWAIARRQPSGGAPEQWVACIYNVSDLIEPAARDSHAAPLVSTVTGFSTPRPAGSGSGGGLFGSDQRTLRRQSVDDVIALMRSSLSIWHIYGASILPVGDEIVVVQTRDNHQIIRAFLAELRAASLRKVRVEIVWASLDDAELSHVAISAATSLQTMDLDALSRQQGVVRYRAQIIATVGATTRVNTGSARTVVMGVNSVFGDNSAHYEPDIQNILDGAAAELTVTLDGNGQTASIDMQAGITRHRPDGQPISMPDTIGTDLPDVKIDRLNLDVQDLSTRLRIPVGHAVVVGATDDPTSVAQSGRRMYVVVRVTPVK